ncbi:MAG TPA: hypothetical protein V6D34_14800 [Candidatus Sericytochromatia bacterium]
MSHSIFTRVAPAQKLCPVEALQSRGEIGTMTGDEVRDTPVEQADIGRREKPPICC